MRLRTLLCLLAVLSVWFGMVSNSARKIRRAMTEIEKRGGHMMFADQWDFFSSGELPVRHNHPYAPFVHWIRNLIGPEFFASIAAVTVTTAGDDLAFLDMVPRLKALSVEKSTVSDSGLSAIENQTELIYLWLDDTRISDTGLTHLRKMKKLEYLYIRNSLVTDAGIAALKKYLPAARICYGNEPEQKFQ